MADLVTRSIDRAALERIINLPKRGICNSCHWSKNKLVLECVRKGLGGLEALTGIPGSVGGGVKMNAGGTFGDIGASVESVMLMDRDGNVFEKSSSLLQAQSNNVIKMGIPGSFFIIIVFIKVKRMIKLSYSIGI